MHLAVKVIEFVELTNSPEVINTDPYRMDDKD
jgi:hypothetical protein